MAFQVKNSHMHKKISTFSLMILLTLSLLLVQFSPVSAQEEKATLTGVINDEGVDINGDMYFDYLRVGVEVDVTVAGTYTVSIAGFYSPSNTSATVYAESSIVLDAGVTIVYLDLNGTRIYDSGLDPYYARGINLYDENTTQLDVLSKVAFSQEYFYDDFEHPGAEPKMADFTGDFSDEGVDLDDDGFFDSLTIGVELNVTVAGTYTVSVEGLYDTGSVSSSVTAKTTTYLDVGVSVVYVALNGSSIYADDIDPASIIKIKIYDENDTLLSTQSNVDLSQEYLHEEFQPTFIEFLFTNVERKIFLDEAGSIYVTNSYILINVGFEVSEVDITLPEGAYDVVVRDEMGELETTTKSGVLTVPFRDELETGMMETIYMAYRVPWEYTVNQENGVNYNLAFTFCEGINSTIENLDVYVVLPRGAVLETSSSTPDDTTTSGFQETMYFSFSDLEPLAEPSFTIDYKHLLFWDSFYPTIWIGIVVVAAAVVSFFWKAPKLVSAPTIQVPPKDLKTFVELYEEKAEVKSELVSLEEILSKGKVSRRRYKVRRKMLEGRLTTVNRSLSSLSDTIRSGGAQYASLMRQIDSGETKLDGAEKDLQRVESRYKRGEISKSAYGKLVEEYKSRIEDAQDTIDGALLRLRE